MTGGLDDFLRSVGAAASVEHDKKRLLLLMPPYLHKRGDWQARQDWLSIAHSVSQLLGVHPQFVASGYMNMHPLTCNS